MRRIAWIAMACFVVAVTLSLVGQATEAEALYLPSGLLLLTALGLGLAALPVWDRLGLRLPAMPGLFAPVGQGQVWDPVAGGPVPRSEKPERTAPTRPAKGAGKGAGKAPRKRAPLAARPPSGGAKKPRKP